MRPPFAIEPADNSNGGYCPFQLRRDFRLTRIGCNCGSAQIALGAPRMACDGNPANVILPRPLPTGRIAPQFEGYLARPCDFGPGRTDRGPRGVNIWLAIGTS